MEEVDKNVLESSKPKRRTFTKAFKAALVAEAERGERSVADIAMSNQINANQLRRWMTEADQSNNAGAMVPVTMAADHLSTPLAPLEVIVANVTLRFHPPWDAPAIASLLKALQ